MRQQQHQHEFGRPGRCRQARRVHSAGARAGGERPRVEKLAAAVAQRHNRPAGAGYSAVGLASWYGAGFHGHQTAEGETFDMNSFTAAHPTLPIPCNVRVTNLSNHRSIVVRVNDRGPYIGHRLIDVSTQTAKVLGFYGHGLAKVRIDYVGRAPQKNSDGGKAVAIE